MDGVFVGVKNETQELSLFAGVNYTSEYGTEEAVIEAMYRNLRIVMNRLEGKS